MSRQTDTAASRDPRLSEVMDQAGDWLLRLREDDLSPETIEAWLRWYHEDAEHRRAFRELQGEYERLKAVPGTRRRQMARRVLAGTEAVAPGVGETAESPARRWPLRARLSAGFAMAATVVLGVAVGLWQLNPPPAGDTGVYRTERGAHEVLNLPDGSVVTLGARSTASYRFTDDRRRVVLESGEAFFEVAKDSRRPFVVEVDDMTVRAVGTAFNIRRSDDMMVVSVSEGSVDVRGGDPLGLAVLQILFETEPTRLTSGKQAVVSAAERDVVSVKPTNPDSVQSWKSGRLEFVDEPLSVVIATVNRYSDRDIVLTDRDLGKVPLTGAVMHNHIEEWLLALPDIFPLHVEVAANNTIRVSPTQNHVADTR